MRKIVAGLYMSLDGVVDSPDGWQYPYLNDELQEMIDAEIAQADAVLLGTRTYLDFARLWPGKGSDTLMAGFMNSAPKYIVSSSLDTLEWANSTLLTGDLAKELVALRQEPGKNILIPGSPTLVRSLLRGGLLDELSLAICPIVVGTGMHLFDEIIDHVGLTLHKCGFLGTGVLWVTYRPADRA